MNIFRLAGDMTHLLSIVVLLLKIRATRSCRGEQAGRSSSGAFPHSTLALTPHPTNRPSPAGISLKTQELYALVFACRYLDLFYSYVSL